MEIARRSQPFLLVLALSVCAFAQVSNRPASGAPPARSGIGAAPPAPPAGHRNPAPRPGRGGGVIVPYGWGWGWGGTNVIVQEKEVEKEPAYRPWVENKEYAPERLHPSTSDYPDGSLPASKLGRSPKFVPCSLVLTSGERAQSPTCERRADLVSYVDPTGRRIWLSTDLIDWTQSRFGSAP